MSPNPTFPPAFRSTRVLAWLTLVSLVGLRPTWTPAAAPTVPCAEPGSPALPGTLPIDPPSALVPHFRATARVDGVLDEPEWTQAAALTGFTLYIPVDGRSADDSTRVLVWYSDQGLYVGIQAFEIHGSVQATLADRDKIERDDHVQILLDTFDDRRQAFLLGTNPFGVQADGMIRDAARRTSVFITSDTNAPYLIDLTPDFVFESKGRLTPFGFEIELFIPFKSLRYQATDVQTWGFNVIRRVQHSGFAQAWAPIRRENASFLAQSGSLQGLSGLRRGRVLDATPVLTWGGTRSDASSERFETNTPEPGGDVRWGVTNNLTLNATVNPDFSQVEADVVQFAYDPRRAVHYPEKRPFFLDGIELFSTPEQIIYTRRVSRPVGAVKLTGKVGSTGLGFLSGVDRRSTSTTGSDFRVFNALRLSRDVGSQSSVGLAYTDKVDGPFWNRVGSVDSRIVSGGRYSVTLQAAGSLSRTPDAPDTKFGPLWLVRAVRSGRRLSVAGIFSGVSGAFRAETGFISRTNLVLAAITPQVTLFGKPGALVETVTGSADIMGRWVYDDFVRGRSVQDKQLFLNTRLGLRGGWSVGPGMLVETFGYPSDLYTDTFIERTDASGTPVDTVAFTGTPHLNNLTFVANIRTPQFDRFSARGFALYGRDENWWEWAGADLLIIDAGLNWTPSEQLRLELLYNHVQYIRPGDRSTVDLRRVPRLKVEYQLTRSIFVRVVGQYDAQAVDDLRDNTRTEDPLLFRQPDGTVVRAVAHRRNDLRLDWLFSYRPTPGTVFFLGYGSSLDEPNSFRFHPLDRRSDGFFMKLSYLFRV